MLGIATLIDFTDSLAVMVVANRPEYIEYIDANNSWLRIVKQDLMDENNEAVLMTNCRKNIIVKMRM